MQLVLRGTIALTLVGTVGYACYVIYWQKPSVPPTPATSVQNAPEPKEHIETLLKPSLQSPWRYPLHPLRA